MKSNNDIQTSLFAEAAISANAMLSAGSFTVDQKLLALSWKQPYAELMLHGKIETRTWKTKYRGWVMICASKMGYNFNQVHGIAGDKQLVRITEVLGRNNDHYLNNYRSGIAIAIGRLIDCRPMQKQDEAKCFVEYYPDLFCHVYDSVQPIEPIIWKGSQGWKEVTEDVKRSIVLL